MFDWCVIRTNLRTSPCELHREMNLHMSTRGEDIGEENPVRQGNTNLMMCLCKLFWR